MKFLDVIEHNLKYGTQRQKRIALELLFRFVEGRL
jgi:hypothetical protein